MEVLDQLGMLDPPGSPVDPGGDEALVAACQVIAAIYRTPDEALRSDLESGRLARVTDTLARREGLEPPGAPHAPPDFETLRVSYVALFVSRVGGVPAPPYAGLVRDRQLMGPTVRRLRLEFERLGLRPAPEWRELPDHISAIAEAIDLLVERGRIDAGFTLAASYLAPWFARYAEAVASADESGFYGELSRFVRDVLRELLP